MIASLRAVWLVSTMSFRVSPWQSLLALLEVAGQSLNMLQPLFLAWLVNGVARHDGHQVGLGAAGFVVSVALNMALQLVGTHARVIQYERVGFEFDEQIARITASIPTLDHLESARYQDQIQVLRDQQGTLGSAFNSLLNMVRNLVYAVGTILVAATADWRLALLLVVAVPGLLVTRWTVRWDKQGEEESADPARRTGHFMELLSRPTSGAELRVLGVRTQIRGMLERSVADWRRPIVHAQLRTGAVRALDSVVFFGAASLVIAWIVNDAISGRVEPGTVALAVMVVGRLQQTVAIVRSTLQQVTKLIRNVGRFTWLRAYAAEVGASHEGRTQPPARLRDGIRLEGLTYRYEGSQHDSLHRVTLDLPAGSVVALVGENGAGKSTLVKLLTGMYLPTSGSVRVDGTDLRELDGPAWRARTSGAFQDHARFELSARESVGLGDLPHLDDDASVLTALRAGAAEDVLGSLPEGLDTQLGTTWPGGVGLSGGQWQRLAIARAMMRQDPLLLVLDEPASSLDAATEHALFERYATASREAGGRGAVTLLVTHRFSTVAAADLVVVLDAGRVLEVGSHAELMAAGGRYAELYELQARGYR